MKRNLLRDAQGRLKPALAAPIVLVLYFASRILAGHGFVLLSAGLFRFWGLTDKSLPYAPLWLQICAANLLSLQSAVQSLFGLLCVLLCAKFLRKSPLRIRIRHIYLGAGIGFGLSAAAFVLLFCTGSVRCMPAAGVFPLAEAIVCLDALASAFAAEALLGGFLAPQLRVKPMARLVLMTAAGALLYVPTAYWTLPSIACVLAMAASCAVLYEKRSFAAAAALRGGFAVFAHRLLGFSAEGAPGIFFETYPVSRDWLTGGDFGLESGWLCAALFAAGAIVLWKYLRKETER